MLGGNKIFTFHGKSLTHRGYEAVTDNYDYYYEELRKRDCVPVVGTEDLEVLSDNGEVFEWQLKIMGKECDTPYQVYSVTQEGDIEWFTTPEDTSDRYSKV